MSAKTDYLESAMINLVLRNTPFTAVTPYVGLFTAAPGEAGGGTEVVGNNYARKAITFDAPSPAGETQNAGNPDTFNQATPSGWGTITHMAIFDASTSGNMLYYGALSASVAVGAGDEFKFNQGDLQVDEL